MRLQTRKKIAKALRSYWRRFKQQKDYEVKEKRRRNLILKSLKESRRTHTTAAERRWGTKLAEEQKRERKKEAAIRKDISPKDRAIRYLERIAAKVDADTIVDSKTHADGSLDAELRIAIPRGENGSKMVLDLAEHIILPRGMWAAFGWIFAKGVMSDDEIEDYERYHKLLQVHSHYRHVGIHKPGRMQATPGGIQAARDIYKSLMKNKRRKPEQFYIRLHWSPDGKKPE